MKACFWISMGSFSFSILYFSLYFGGAYDNDPNSKIGCICAMILFALVGIILGIIALCLKIKRNKKMKDQEFIKKEQEKKDLREFEKIRRQEKEKQLAEKQLEEKQNKEQIQIDKARQKLICPRCHSNNTNVQIISEQKGTGFFRVLLYILLAVTILGIPIMLIILLCKGKKTITHKDCVCQECGKSWRID